MVSFIKNYIAAVFVLFSLVSVGRANEPEHSVIIDDMKNDKAWFKWPKNEVSFRLSKDAKVGSRSLRVDFRENPGIIGRSIPGYYLKDSVPKAISMWMKAADGNQNDRVVIALQEGKGKEKYLKTVKLEKEWKKYTLQLKDFEINRYGKPQIVDDVLDVEDISSMKFEGYPKGNVFLVDDIRLITGKKVKVVKVKDGEWIPRIKEIEMSETFPDYSANYPEVVQNVKIQGGNFARDGKPVFMVGGWTPDNEGPPWFMRALGIEIYPFGATEIYTLYTPKKDGPYLDLVWKENPWYEAMIHRALKNKVMFWHEHKSHYKWNAIKKFFPEILDSGHFVSYDPYNPIGVKFYQEMYKSWMRYTRKYPVFCYELFNEMTYNNTKKISRDAFREAMIAKYNSLEVMNEKWGTSFKSLKDIQPPGFIASNNKLKKESVEVLSVRESLKYPNLSVDWRTFQEGRSAGAIKSLMKKMRSYDPNPKKLSTVQTHGQLWFDYGDIGLNPEAIEQASDFYSQEVGQTFCQVEKNESINNVKRMMNGTLSNDIVRNICKKPVFNAEAPIGVSSRIATEEDLVEADFAKLHGEWDFIDVTDDQLENWGSKDYSDDQWKSIIVPGMWGKQGYNNCKIGLYRKTFDFNLSNLDKGKIIYLNGKAFADSSEIYLNGVHVGNTEGFQSAFSFDISSLLKDKNELRVKVVNTYFHNGMYFGGIRGHVAINDFSSTTKGKPMLKPGHFRSHMWSNVAHGMSGLMLCYETSLYNNSARVIPRVKKEIESVSSIVLPRPRIKSQVSFVYPFETNRGVTHKGYIEKLSGPVTSDLLDYYAPILFSGLGADVIRNKDIISDRADLYKILVMAGNNRVKAGEIEKLDEYVKNGGVLVAEYGSLSIDDKTHNPIDPGALFGIKINGLSDEVKEIAPNDMLGGVEVKTKARYLDKMSHASVEATTAEVLVRFTDGTPAITVRKHGEGKAYYIAAKLSYTAFSNFFKVISAEQKVTAPVSVMAAQDGEQPRFVETNLFSKGDSHVLYALNWGKSVKATLKLNTIGDGEYRIRNVATGNQIGSGVWTAEQLRKGMSLSVPSLDPIVMLLEKTGVEPLVIKNISPKRYKMLNELWTQPEYKDDAPVVSFAPIRSMANIYGDSPTAKKLLQLRGYKTEPYEFKKTDLSKTKVLVWRNGRSKPDSIPKILDFVKNGGGLLICGTGMTNYHLSVNGIRPLMNELGIDQSYLKYIKTDNPAPGDDLLQVPCTELAESELTKYVKEFKTSLSGIISLQPKNAETIIKAPKDSSHPGAAIMTAFSYGKGRIVYISDYWWVRPLNIDLADNAQLWVNTIDWLAGKEVQKLTAEQRDQGLFMTHDKFEKAEAEEEKQLSTFKPFESRKSSLTDAGDLQGISGGDPIVDMLK